ncbi:ABC transporter ATP-binding protein [Ensifer sp. ENS06]|uniref:ABC transporter ATP-binding protein n=1 Tax=Ensifer sp. ENS06 TaxID=2769276 RepID=UPI001782B97A|nr:ABC transporter ATP-binding protein [Ensifer sp. ENS06]MBD9627005.1 ABC transporter ATP-binding protein [Ensifer sp. ENS06]
MVDNAAAPPLKPVAFSLLGTFWHDARTTLVLVVGAALVGAVTAVVAPVLFSWAIDALAARGQTSEALSLIFLYAVIFGVSTAVSQAARYLTFMCGARLSFIADCAFFSRLLAKTSNFFLEHNQTEIGNARNEGGQALGIILQFGIGGILPGLVQIAVTIALLGGVLSWEIALIVLVYGIVIIGLDYFRAARVNPFLDAAIDKSQENSRLVGNAVAVIETLRHTRGETWMARRFTASAGDAFANWRRYSLVSSLFSAVSGIAVALQLIVTFFILVPRFEAGLISIGELVLFNTLLLQLNEPFNLVGQAIKESADAVARFRPFASMWNAPEETEHREARRFRSSTGAIAFERVSFHYANGRGVNDLSFLVRRGAPAFLIGETGSGKSTVLRMLLKDVRPVQGRILIDDTDLATVTRDDWFSQVGVVPQDIALLNDTLAVNIVLGRPFDESRLRRAAERASILQRIEAMPQGFDTVVGERGMKLSGGERQRIAIARALYGEPSILILDEASSALDGQTEAEIMDGLRALAGNLTILSVTHRTSIIHAGDQVIRLNAQLLHQ